MERSNVPVRNEIPEIGNFFGPQIEVVDNCVYEDGIMIGVFASMDIDSEREGFRERAGGRRGGRRGGRSGGRRGGGRGMGRSGGSRGGRRGAGNTVEIVDNFIWENGIITGIIVDNHHERVASYERVGDGVVSADVREGGSGIVAMVCDRLRGFVPWCRGLVA